MVVCTCTKCRLKNLRGCNIASHTRLAHEVADQERHFSGNTNYEYMEIDNADGKVISNKKMDLQHADNCIHLFRGRQRREH